MVEKLAACHIKINSFYACLHGNSRDPVVYLVDSLIGDTVDCPALVLYLSLYVSVCTSNDIHLNMSCSERKTVKKRNSA